MKTAMRYKAMNDIWPTNRVARDLRAHRPAFSLIELLVVISIITALIAMLLPAVQAAREVSRRTQCASNLRQLALAALSFHTAHSVFPSAGTTSSTSSDAWGQIGRLLPYLDQGVLVKSINFNKETSDPANADAWTAPLPVLRCPSDGDRLSGSSSQHVKNGWTRNSYRGNAGNDNGEVSSAKVENNNGVFVTGRRVSAAQILDGVSMTALFSEALLGDGNDDAVTKPSDWFVISPPSHSKKDIYDALTSVTPTAGSASQVSYSGREYMTGQYLTTRYNHIMPPNGPSGVIATGSDLIVAVNTGAQATTASSHHAGGVNLALADGAVRFIADVIDVSTWQAIGSIRCEEKIREEF
jgi:prepilin-type N-terminal cleavage/methylation domain-containing protein